VGGLAVKIFPFHVRHPFLKTRCIYTTVERVILRKKKIKHRREFLGSKHHDYAFAALLPCTKMYRAGAQKAEAQL